MLKAKVLAAVEKARLAVQDLAFEATLISRGTATHVPGSAPTHPETSVTVSLVPTKFETKEIDGERIRSTDLRWLMFPVAGKPVPTPNDLIYVGTKRYRIIDNDKVMAGSDLALSQLQVRIQ